VKHPKEHSQRFPIKAMFMGVVAPPNLEHGFNGSVMIERISKMKKQSNGHTVNTLLTITYLMSKSSMAFGKVSVIIQFQYPNLLFVCRKSMHLIIPLPIDFVLPTALMVQIVKQKKG
jgi:hypothetical protein